MTISDIIKRVRFCIDEESGFTDYEDTYLDNIIKSSIGASLRWCALYADSVLLTDGTGTTDTSLATDYTITVGDESSTPEGLTYDTEDGYLVLPSTALRVTRVRVNTWNKGCSAFIAEDSDEYLMQSDDTAKATTDRPVAAIIQTNPLRIECFPKPSSGDVISVSLVNTPDDTDYTESAGTSDIYVPVKMQGAFIYYLAYLVMCAFENSAKGTLMLTIAQQQIAIKAS